MVKSQGTGSALRHGGGPVRAWKLRTANGMFAVISMPSLVYAPPGLTSSEIDVIAGILRGASNREIAADRGTSARTVANQLASIYQKLGLGSRAELIVFITRLQIGVNTRNGSSTK